MRRENRDWARWVPSALAFLESDAGAVLQRFGRADDQVLAADQSLANFQVFPAAAASGDDDDASPDRLTVLDDEDRAVTDRRRRHANRRVLGWRRRACSRR